MLHAQKGVWLQQAPDWANELLRSEVLCWRFIIILKLKASAIAEMQAYIAADELVKGGYDHILR